MHRPRIGLLPLYLKLYDDAEPRRRSGFDPFLATVAQGLAAHGLEVVRGEVCRLASEVEAALERFATERVEVLVTLHLAYSPSGETVPALLRTDLPLVIMDTTMDTAFGPNADPDRIMYNHGIHGVMDMASVLRRHGRAFEIAAGHVTESDVPARTAALCRAACAARFLRNARALRVGRAFEGMGDFAVEEKVLRERLGIRVERLTTAELAADTGTISSADVDKEMAADAERFTIKAGADVHRRSVQVGLALRRRLRQGGYAAFSANFQAFDNPDGPVMPFLEISKALARGTGYAGEGDVLTAALVGALGRSFGATTFTEIFCPDWRGNSLFLSHMGELNPDLAPDRPLLVERRYPFIASGPTAVLVCGVRPGPAVFVNLAPGPEQTFDLIAAPVEILEDTSRPDLRKTVRAWMRPRRPVAEFLEEYSRRGGTHHSALVLGEHTEALAAFARFAGLGWTVL